MIWEEPYIYGMAITRKAIKPRPPVPEALQATRAKPIPPTKNRHPLFVKGQSGNPSGLRKDGTAPAHKNSWKDIEEFLLGACRVTLTVCTRDGNINKGNHLPLLHKRRIEIDVDPDNPLSNNSIRHAISVRKFKMALDGDMQAIKDTQDRDMGKAPQRIMMEPPPSPDDSKIPLDEAIKRLPPDKLKIVREIVRAGIQGGRPS